MGPIDQRCIIHLDMDEFFVAVERLDRPELLGKPVLVGGDPKGRGVVSTASYEARRYGCHSAMPMAAALRLCPHAVVLPPRIRRYAEASRAVFEIMERFTPQIEPLSIDEAFLDVTGSIQLFGPPEHIARNLKLLIRDETQLIVSAGVAPNKFLAKLASDLGKPDGLVVVPADAIQQFLDPLPISRLWGVGKATLPKLQALGATTFADLREIPEPRLARRFGKAGRHFFRLARGIDDRVVIPDRQAKSISHEMTFPADLRDREELRAVLLEQTEQVARRLRRCRRLARTITLKVRTGDFKTATLSTTLQDATDKTDVLWKSASVLFRKWLTRDPRPVRLIGLAVSHLSAPGGEQLELFARNQRRDDGQLDHTVDTIRDRFGDTAIARGATLRSRSFKRPNPQ